MEGLLNRAHGAMEGTRLTSAWSRGFRRRPHQSHTTTCVTPAVPLNCVPSFLNGAITPPHGAVTTVTILFYESHP